MREIMKNFLITTFAGLLAAATFCACSKDDDNAGNSNNGSQDAILSIDKTAIDAAYTIGTYQLQVTALQAWSAEVNSAATWCSVSPNFYDGSHVATVSVAENIAFEVQRSATITFTAGTFSLAVSVTQAGAPHLLTVTPAAIDAAFTSGSYAVAVTGNTTWTVNSSAAWSTPSPLSGAGNSPATISVAANTATVTRTVSIAFTAGTLTHTIDITQAGAPPAPPQAASAQIWVFGEQMWSDIIQIPECNNADFERNYTEPQCRSYSENGVTWYYYNWPYVNANKNTLCPSPWRVPDQYDLSVLGILTASIDMVEAWGLSGYAGSDGIQNKDNYGYIWSDTHDDPNGNYAYFFYYPGAAPGFDFMVPTDNGNPVRCVQTP
jgi:hypothetical protein